MNVRVLTLLSSNSIEFERISIIFDLRVYLEKYISRVCINEHTVFKTTNGGDLTYHLSISIDIERITNIFDSKWKYCTRNDERMRFKAYFRQFDWIWTYVNQFRFTRISWVLYITRSYIWTYSVQIDERKRFSASFVQFPRYWTHAVCTFDSKIESTRKTHFQSSWHEIDPQNVPLLAFYLTYCCQNHLISLSYSVIMYLVVDKLEKDYLHWLRSRIVHNSLSVTLWTISLQLIVSNCFR